MAIGKVRLVSTSDTPGVQSTGGKPFSGGCIPAEVGPAAEEGLRLVRAFSRIKDPCQRSRLIEAAEAFARTATRGRAPAGVADSHGTIDGVRR